MTRLVGISFANSHNRRTYRTQRIDMPLSSHHKDRTALDYLLYIMAGTVIATLCFSAILWLLI